MEGLVGHGLTIGNTRPCGLYFLDRIVDRPDGRLRCATHTVHLNTRPECFDAVGEGDGNPVAAHHDNAQSFRVDRLQGR